MSTESSTSAFDFVTAPWFFRWLPLVGFHPSMILIVESCSRTWGVFTHLSPHVVGRLGWLDRVLVTPSVHRVHHGKDVTYLDRNYGEVLLLWDHLFGSYTPETQPPTYGVLAKVDPNSLADVQLAPWRALAHDLRRAPDWRARLRYLFDAPGWSHDGTDLRVRMVQHLT